MDKTESTMAQELAAAARAFQLQQTGRAPKNVTVIISEDTLVVTLHEALSPAEPEMAGPGNGECSRAEQKLIWRLASNRTVRRHERQFTSSI